LTNKFYNWEKIIIQAVQLHIIKQNQSKQYWILIQLEALKEKKVNQDQESATVMDLGSTVQDNT
jgi:hypothetical protein